MTTTHRTAARIATITAHGLAAGSASASEFDTLADAALETGTPSYAAMDFATCYIAWSAFGNGAPEAADLRRTTDFDLKVGYLHGTASARNTRRGKVVIDVECGSGLAIVNAH